jgi:hypothetical protein
MKLKLLYIILLKRLAHPALVGHNHFVGPCQLELEPNQSVHIQYAEEYHQWIN